MTPKEARKLLQLCFFYTVIIILIGELTGNGFTLFIATIIFSVAIIVQPYIKLKGRKKNGMEKHT